MNNIDEIEVIDDMEEMDAIESIFFAYLLSPLGREL